MLRYIFTLFLITQVSCPLFNCPFFVSCEQLFGISRRERNKGTAVKHFEENFCSTQKKNFCFFLQQQNDDNDVKKQNVTNCWAPMWVDNVEPWERCGDIIS